MGRLARFEGRLRGAVEGAFAKTFKDGVEPVEIAGALAREADARKAVGPVRTLAPNTYTVALAPSDFERLSPYAEPLGIELATMVDEHGRQRKYAFVGPVTVGFEEEESLSTGLFRVRSEVTAGEEASAEVIPPQHTTVMRIPANPVLVAEVRLQTPGQEDATVTLGAQTTTIGRGADCDITLADSSVSRRHGEITVVDGLHRYTDLGSTNGTTLKGRPIGHVDLADGDVLQLGNATLTYHRKG